MLTQERLKELLYYCPETGVFTWKISPASTTKKGDIAGNVHRSGYLRINVDKKAFYAHRLAYLYIHGYHPENEVDHKNRNKLDNSIKNLREVSRQCNKRNCGNPSTNTSGVKGVSWHKASQKWRAYIKVNNIQKEIGRHSDFLEAVYHRLAGEQCLNWSNCDSSSPALQHIQEFARTTSVD